MVRLLAAFSLILLFATSMEAKAKDFGLYGNSFPIIEEDLLKVISNRLAEIESSGKIDAHNKAISLKTEQQIENPKPVDLKTASKTRTFYYDPAYIVKQDIRDLEGNLIVKAGTIINPFDSISLSKPLVFLDGDDEHQLTWLNKTLEEYKELTIILTKGQPIKLSETLQEEVFFDQQGLITTKLKIEHVPALVTQEDKRLKIEEVSLKEGENG